MAMWFCQPAVAAGDHKRSSEAALPQLTTTLKAADTLELDADPDADAEECLTGLRWTPEEFTVRFEPPDPDRGAMVVRFPSPVTDDRDGVPRDDVALEWYPARDDNDEIIIAPAIIVVHESGSGMTVGRLLARGFSAQGLHAFMIHLPGYGRRKASRREDVSAVLQTMKQGIADTRRARDVVAVLPGVRSDVVGLQGTSLGGFVASTSAALDGKFDRTFIFLAGGNLHEVVLEGARDAAKVRQRLFAAGLDEDGVRELTWPVEPLRVAHRLDPATTWIYSGLYDDVVPPKCSNALAASVGLSPEHHVTFPIDHYSGVVFLPSIILDIANRVRGE